MKVIAAKEMESPEQRLRELGIELPVLPASVGNFQPAQRSGELLFLSGQGPLQADGQLATGKIGKDVSAQQAREHARLTGLVLLAALRAELDSLSRVKKVIKLLGLVNATPDFTEHPYVIDGCSDLLIEVLGEARGQHARSAIGVNSLPMGITVEIEAVVAIED